MFIFKLRPGQGAEFSAAKKKSLFRRRMVDDDETLAERLASRKLLNTAHRELQPAKSKEQTVDHSSNLNSAGIKA